MWDIKFQPIKRGKIIVVYALILKFSESTLESKISINEWEKEFPDLIYFYIFVNAVSIC
jgi:hypothetical protein